ncbi:hypothetical protein OEA41_005343 [Lepraria neglecta]|uniref:Uncharacterized protein n=1 Tax=Lepraria neglecta TaxID=209136 RepID=A0AAE0DGY8_9LECA|nr:hypothetical protein OEA41_005343 [Lepraria neglecta]
MADIWIIWKTTEDKIPECLAIDKPRGDVMPYMIAANESSSEHYMSRDEMEINSMLLFITGSESVTTGLLGARWLSEASDTSSLYKNDRKDVFNLFSLGPHNFPGRTLAYLEMRLILAKMGWHFNMEIPNGMDLRKWEEQEIFWFWDKRPTNVKIRNAR